MIIDCDGCQVRGLACDDCVVSVLLGAPPEVELDSEQQRAIDALADAGMVPQLRLVPVDSRHASNDTPEVAKWSEPADERRRGRAG